MANSKSQIKRNRQNDKKRSANRSVRSELKTREKAVWTALEAGEEAGELVAVAQKRLDMAVAKHVIHQNEAARRKSRLMKAVAG